MNRRFIRLVLLLCLLCSTSPTTAQTTGTPLLQILTLVPDPPQGNLFYADFTAIEQAYPPARLPSDWNEYESLTAETADQLFSLNVWQHVFPNLNLLSASFYHGGEMPAAIGIDFFQIDRVMLSLGSSRNAYYLEGTFDMNAMRAAIVERGFLPQAAGHSFELWCGQDGCDYSNDPDVSRITLADPFGGDLGRQWVRLLSPSLLIGTNQVTDMESVVGVLLDKESSFSKNETLQAAIAALNDQEVLLQAFIPSVTELEELHQPSSLTNPRLTINQRPIVWRALLDAGFETLPAFDLLMFADLASETEQIGQVLLVYSSVSDAQEAAQILPGRIESYESFFYRQPLSERFELLRVDDIRIEVVEAMDRYVVRLTFATPIATGEELTQFVVSLRSDGVPDVTQPGFVYRYLLQSYAAQDIGWLSTVTRESLENLAGS